jgi:putative transposase
MHGRHTAYSDAGTPYPEAFLILVLKHLLHSPYEKSIVERTIEYLKDRTEAFDDYYPCMRAGLRNLTRSQMANSVSLILSLNLPLNLTI